MSLNYSLAAISDWSNVTKHPSADDKINPVTEGLIWITMVVDLPGITPQNIDEFKFRARLYQVACNNPMGGYLGDGTALYITDADIDQHLGLRTNVSATTRAAWLKRFGEMVEDHARRTVKRQNVSAHEAFRLQAERLAAAQAPA